MYGSEKQIEWAKKIIASIESSANETISEINKKSGVPSWAHRLIQHVTSDVIEA